MSNPMQSTRVVAYVDGASRNNQNAQERCGGWGVVLMLVDEQGQRDARPDAYRELSGTLPGATNNQAELEAVRQALMALKREGISITIVTDSDYVIGVLSKHWKPRQNRDLIADVKTLMGKHQITFEKVIGHSGVVYNERADTLAVAASQP